MNQENPKGFKAENSLDIYLGKFNRFTISLIRLLPFGRVSVFLIYASLLDRSHRFRFGYTFFGSRLYCDPIDSIQRRILYFGMWEPDISATILNSLEEGDVFIDIGANIGYDSLLAASKVGRTGRVVAVEASPSIFEKLKANVARNDRPNIRLVNAAVADSRGTVTIVEGPADNIGSTSIADGQPTAGSQIEKYPISEILTDDELSRARLIKMDIEGSELPVMQNILNQIGRYSTELEIITEITLRERRHEWEQLFTAFLDKGFQAYRIENDYHPRRYLDWNGIPHLQQIHNLPKEEMMDIMFTRLPR